MLRVQSRGQNANLYPTLVLFARYILVIFLETLKFRN